jgi:hypothetical protein
MMRPLMIGGVPQDVLLHLSVLVAYTLVAFPLAVRLISKRILT